MDLYDFFGDVAEEEFIGKFSINKPAQYTHQVKRVQINCINYSDPYSLLLQVNEELFGTIPSRGYDLHYLVGRIVQFGGKAGYSIEIELINVHDFMGMIDLVETFEQYFGYRRKNSVNLLLHSRSLSNVQSM